MPDVGFQRILDESEATKRRFHFASMALAVEQIRDALGWPKDASHEERFALARKALDDLIQRHADAERRRYDAEVRAERAEFTVRQVREAIEFDVNAYMDVAAEEAAW